MLLCVGGRKLSLIISLMIVSLTLTVGNKWVVQDGIHAPMTVLTVQNSIASVVLGLLIRSGIVSMQPLRWAHVLTIAVCSVGMCVQLAANMIALPHVSVATLTVFANSRALVQAVCERLLLGERFGFRAWIALSIISLSAVQYARHDLSSTAAGMIWLTVNTACFVAIGLYKRFFYSRMKGPTGQSSTAISLIENMISIPLFVGFIVWGGESGWSVAPPGATAAGAHFFDPTSCGIVQMWQSPPITQALIAGTGVFCGLIGMLYTQLFKELAATTITVIGSITKVVAIVLSVHIFGTVIPAPQALMLLIVVIAATWFALERRRMKSLEEVAKVASEAASNLRRTSIAMEEAFEESVSAAESA
jgi:drug/metabolite transporter (DMT)-like permease